MNLKENARKNVSDILSICLHYDSHKEKVVIIFDTRFGLTSLLTEAYKEVLPHAKCVNFDTSSKEEILALFETLSPSDLVILIQSTNFLLNEFRIRLHLFNKKLKVIEHMHLSRNDESMWETYIDSLAYDTSWYPVVAPKIKEALRSAKNLTITSQDKTLTCSSLLEEAKLNIGDYTGMENIGGTFPIGEVFTEAKNLQALNGEVYIYAFADKNFTIQMYDPFLIEIKEGIIVSYGENTPTSFKEILSLVKEYERPIIREIGFGLNKAITKEKYVGDITAFERICGMHFSLGEKHSVYKKEGMTTKKTKFHVDIFPVVDIVSCGEMVLFRDGKYSI